MENVPTRLGARLALVLLLLVPLRAMSGDADGASGLLADVAAARASGKVDARALEQVQRHGSARFLVALTPTAATSRGAGPASRRTAIRRARERVLARAAGADLEVRRRFSSLSGIAVTGGPGLLRQLAEDPEVAHVAFDEPVEGQLLEALAVAEVAPLQGLGRTGAGVTVAVLDSGIDASHPDLAGAIVDERCYCSDYDLGCCPDGETTQTGAGAAADDNGHGTHVTSVIAGRGQVAGPGAAPAASIVAIKVLDADNSSCCVSDILAGLDYVLTERTDVDFVNLSLASLSLYKGTCDNQATGMLYAEVIAQLRDAGVLVFASSGNQGSANKMPLPACVADAVSVAASWDADVGVVSFPAYGCTDDLTGTDVVACFSNTNQTTDLVAPGAPTTGSWLGGGVATLYGTSQSAPLAAGCAALLREAVPAATPQDIEAALEASPVRLVDPDNGIAIPRLDCEHALDTLLEAFRCGDAVVDAEEDCDDGNRDSFDGCSAGCRLEPGFACAGEPSLCAASIPSGIPLAGKRLLIRNRLPDKPERNKLLYITRDEAVALPAAGSPADPRCVEDGGSGLGGTLYLTSGASGEQLVAPLPCGGWKLSSSESEPKKYRYRSSVEDPGACQSISLRAGRYVKVQCKGLDVGFDLKLDVEQQPVGLLLDLGGQQAYCARFGGDVIKSGRNGKAFLATRAPPPPSCP